MNFVDTKEKCSPGELQQQLGCSAALISKMSANLLKKQIITVSVNEGDKRSRSIQLSRIGRKVLTDQNKLRLGLIDKVFNPLSRAERCEIGELLHLLADKVKAPASQLPRTAHPVLPALERLTRAFRLLGGHVGNTALSPQEFHILRALTNGCKSAKEVGKLVGFHPSKVSRHIESLTRRKLIDVVSSATDGRVKALTLTSRGASVLQDSLHTTLASAQQLLKGFDSHRLEQLLTRYLEAPMGVENLIAQTESDPSSIRTLYLKEMARRGALDQVSPKLFEPKAIWVAIRRSSTLCGAVMYESKNKPPSLVFGIGYPDEFMRASADSFLAKS